MQIQFRNGRTTGAKWKEKEWKHIIENQLVDKNFQLYGVGCKLISKKFFQTFNQKSAKINENTELRILFIYSGSLDAYSFHNIMYYKQL